MKSEKQLEDAKNYCNEQAVYTLYMCMLGYSDDEITYTADEYQFLIFGSKRYTNYIFWRYDG